MKKLAPGTVVEIWSPVLSCGIDGNIYAWQVGRAVVADNGQTVIVRQIGGDLDGAISRHDRRNVRARFEPGDRVRYRRAIESDFSLNGTVESRQSVRGLPSAVYKYGVRLENGDFALAWPSQVKDPADAQHNQQSSGETRV